MFSPSLSVKPSRTFSYCPSYLHKLFNPQLRHFLFLAVLYWLFQTGTLCLTKVQHAAEFLSNRLFQIFLSVMGNFFQILIVNELKMLLYCIKTRCKCSFEYNVAMLQLRTLIID